MIYDASLASLVIPGSHFVKRWTIPERWCWKPTLAYTQACTRSAGNSHMLLFTHRHSLLGHHGGRFAFPHCYILLHYLEAMVYRRGYSVKSFDKCENHVEHCHCPRTTPFLLGPLPFPNHHSSVSSVVPSLLPYNMFETSQQFFPVGFGLRCHTIHASVCAVLPCEITSL